MLKTVCSSDGCDDTQAHNHVPVVSVSRRFNDDYVDHLYDEVIKPALSAAATILECHYASEDAEASDFWINRMGVIQDISDVHLILDLHRSGPTLYEFHYSNLLCSGGFRNFLALNFDCHPVYNHRKVRVIVHDQVRYHPCSPSYSIRPLRIATAYPKTRGTDIVIWYDAADLPSFKRAFAEAIATAMLAVSQQRIFLSALAGEPLYRKIMYAESEASSSAELLLSPSVYYRVCAAIAQRIGEGATIPDLIEEIIAVSADGVQNQVSSEFSEFEARGETLEDSLGTAESSVIAAYNRLLAELVKVSRQVLDDPTRYDWCHRYAVLAGIVATNQPSQLRQYFAEMVEDQIGITELGSNWALVLITRLQAYYIRYVMMRTVKR